MKATELSALLLDMSPVNVARRSDVVDWVHRLKAAARAAGELTHAHDVAHNPLTHWRRCGELKCRAYSALLPTDPIPTTTVWRVIAPAVNGNLPREVARWEAEADQLPTVDATGHILVKGIPGGSIGAPWELQRAVPTGWQTTLTAPKS